MPKKTSLIESARYGEQCVLISRQKSMLNATSKSGKEYESLFPICCVDDSGTPKPNILPKVRLCAVLCVNVYGNVKTINRNLPKKRCRDFSRRINILNVSECKYGRKREKHWRRFSFTLARVFFLCFRNWHTRSTERDEREKSPSRRVRKKKPCISLSK